jgi:hypothetical protein
MYQILDFTKNKIDSIEDFKSIIDLSSNLPVIIIDNIEADSFWPSQKFGRKIVYELSTFLQNYKGDAYYITSDLNAKHLYDDFLKITNFDKKIKIIIYPYSSFIKEPEHHALDDKLIKNLKFFDNSIVYGRRNITLEIDNNFISLISHPKNYRIYFLNIVKDYKNFNYSFIPPKNINNNFETIHSMNDLREKLLLKIINPFEINPKAVEFSSLNFKQMTEIPDFLHPKSRKYDNPTFQDKLHLVPIEYLKSNVDIVCESYCSESLFYSEKTWKPILFKKPFLILGSKNQNRSLTKFGFNIYDDVFDYSFDEEENLIDRIDGLVAQIQKFINIPPLEFRTILKKIRNKIDYNYVLYKHLLMRENKYISCFIVNDYEKIENLIERMN